MRIVAGMGISSVVQTNLIESYDRLQAFGIKHLMDKFFLEDGVRISLRARHSARC